MEGMNMTRPIAILVALASLAAAGWASAQASNEGIARLKGVKGNVLLSREAGLAAGGESARLVEHTRVITTAGSEVVVVYDNGCEVRLKENQRFEVEDGKPCSVLVALPQTILATPAGMATAALSTGAIVFGTALPALGGATIAVELLRDSREKTPLSPS
jgi:hypothetical protein